jgi:hypothetical protein
MFDGHGPRVPHARRFEKMQAVLDQKTSSSANTFTSAFVTFETEAAKDKALRAYRPHRCAKRTQTAS